MTDLSRICRNCRYWDDSDGYWSRPSPEYNIMKYGRCLSPAYITSLDTWETSICGHHKWNTFGKVADPKARAHYKMVEGNG